MFLVDYHGNLRASLKLKDYGSIVTLPEWIILIFSTEDHDEVLIFSTICTNYE